MTDDGTIIDPVAQRTSFSVSFEGVEGALVSDFGLGEENPVSFVSGRIVINLLSIALSGQLHEGGRQIFGGASWVVCAIQGLSLIDCLADLRDHEDRGVDEGKAASRDREDRRSLYPRENGTHDDRDCQRNGDIREQQETPRELDTLQNPERPERIGQDAHHERGEHDWTDNPGAERV